MSGADVLPTTPSYHDLHITAADIPRTKLFNLSFNLMVTCTRAGGWELWRNVSQPGEEMVAGEYGGPDKWLVLDVAGYIIVDSRKPEGADPDQPGETSRVK